MGQYFFDLNDKRIQTVYKLFNNKGLDFLSNINKVEQGDIVIVSPAYKWEKMLYNLLPANIKIYGGRIVDNDKEFLSKFQYFNFMEDESFVMKNALFTAEGFLSDLILNTTKSIYEQKILILGSGRVAKSVEYLFAKLGVPFDISMRNEKELNFAKLLAERTIPLKEINNKIAKYDTIINTIPSVLFDNHTEFKKGSVVFELASISCFLDKSKVKEKYVLCPALPSKYLPESAGKLIYEYIIKKEGIKL